MKALILTPLLFLAACSSTPKETTPVAATLPTTLEEALQSPYRTEAHKVRDSARHPAETLEFFGLKPDMTVVEISPSGGWYAEILAPYLNANGKYIAAATPISVYSGGQKFLDWLDANPNIKAKVTVNDFMPGQGNVAEDNSADMVLTFRNVHNWTKNKKDQAAFESFFKALKKGGILGVVEHRANKNQKKIDGKSGYVPEQYVIRIAEKAGFKLVAKSEINANPNDTKNYAKGVWTLPPNLAEGEKDREKYQAIGESDRMTLKFVKP